MAPQVRCLKLNPTLRAYLRSLCETTKSPTAAAVVLARGNGESQVSIARRLSISRRTVYRWERRYERFGVDGLVRGLPGRPRKSYMPEEAVSLLQGQIQRMTARGVRLGKMRKRITSRLAKMPLKPWRQAISTKLNPERRTSFPDQVHYPLSANGKLLYESALDIRTPFYTPPDHPVFYPEVLGVKYKGPISFAIRRDIRDIKGDLIPANTKALFVNADQRRKTVTIAIRGVHRILHALSLVLILFEGKDNRVLSFECVDQEPVGSRLRYWPRIHFLPHIHVENYRVGDILVFNHKVIGVSAGSEIKVKEIVRERCLLILEDGRSMDPLIAMKEWIDENPYGSKRANHLPWGLVPGPGHDLVSLRAHQAMLKEMDRRLFSHQTLERSLLFTAELALPRFQAAIYDGITNERLFYRNHGTDKQYWRTRSGRMSIRAKTITNALDTAFAMPTGLSKAQKERYRSNYWKVTETVHVYTKPEYLKAVLDVQLYSYDDALRKCPSDCWINVEANWEDELKRCGVSANSFVFQSAVKEKHRGLYWNVRRAFEEGRLSHPLSVPLDKVRIRRPYIRQ